MTIKTELEAATGLLPTLKSQIAASDPHAAKATVDALVQHTSASREAANDPIWKAASWVPGLGTNLQAASEIATSADDIARLGAVPLVSAFQSLNWKALTPRPSGMDLSPLKESAPSIDAAAQAVRESARRLDNIEVSGLLPQIASPLTTVRKDLETVTEQLDSAADVAKLAPTMLGSDSPRRYLLLMQNNAESRASGGIPGALAVVSLDAGKFKLESQTSASSLGAFVPSVAIDAEQSAIFSPRVGKFMQDVNLTPDFATTAVTAHTMWERKTGEQLDGVLSIDPIALSLLLDATGPVRMPDSIAQKTGTQLPSELTGGNVVRTLLSDVYAAIPDPALQDAYFAAAANEVFAVLSAGKTDPTKLLEAITEGVAQHRILLWSAAPTEQATIGKYPLAGLVSGSSVSPAQFGVYFNDGTGAKMDYWIKRSVQVAKDCTRDGYRQVTIRVTSTNTAPRDAASSLPKYVTGNGAFGVPPGSVQTNIVAYGPVQSNIDTVVKDGQQIPFAAQRHSQRAVGTSTIRLAPGESTSVEFNFGHIVQHSDPKLVVTPTTQPIKDVIQGTVEGACE
ncbi:DUF4012 domain-containing protein [Paenarthrobacter nicotinovorans]|uniref:DUF4012 domain-containing protein n=1 Tax=Paenarthrobacter nicotinovorans TaxID=29320 RepID=UPI0028CB7F5B|nr:DUF4012 domain-containing protein [Paenarthrobacter nicotinovorans]